PAGQQDQAASTHAYREAALAGDAVGEDEHLVFVDLDLDRVVGLGEVDGQVGVGAFDRGAHVPGQLRGDHGETLVPAAGPHRERAGAVGHGLHRDLGDGVHVFGDPAHQVHPHDPHDVAHALGQLGHFEVGGTGHAQHDDAFALGEPEFGQAFSGGADVVLQTALEQVPVAALEHDLPELQEHTQLAQLLRGCPDRAVRTRVDGGGVERG